VDFTEETKLVTNDVLDSFDIIAIVSDLCIAFDVEINVNDLEPENFDSAGAIWELVQRLKEE
jgi:acyl carrier protein